MTRLVKPGGILIYSTCSIDPEENEHRITAFVQRHPDFIPQSVHGYIPAEFVTGEDKLCHNEEHEVILIPDR
ncbi:hypothetical protein ABZP36_035439 [Zizania latifolia]